MNPFCYHFNRYYEPFCMFIYAIDSSKEMLGTFGPQAEPNIHMMPEETMYVAMLDK